MSTEPSTPQTPDAELPLASINLADKLALFSEQWSPKIIAAMNDYHLKIAKIEGDFVWHSHPDTDEVFIVLDGAMDLELRHGTVRLEKGEAYVVPQGVEHRPRATGECSILMIEKAGTVNTGDTGGDRTAEAEWL